VKIKQDFVTNSSSTSFCAWGIGEFADNHDEGEDYLPEKLLKRSYDHYIQSFDCKKRFYRSTTDNPISYNAFCEKIRDFDCWYTENVVDYLRTLDLDSIFFAKPAQPIQSSSPKGSSIDLIGYFLKSRR